MNIDDIFMEEIKTHNALLDRSSELSDIFSKIVTSGFNVSDHISSFINSIHKKDFDKSRDILQDTVYLLSGLIDNLLATVENLTLEIGYHNDEKNLGDKSDE